MREVSITQARAQLSQMVRLAQSGESIVVTRKGEPVVRIIAYPTLLATESSAPCPEPVMKKTELETLFDPDFVFPVKNEK